MSRAERIKWDRIYAAPDRVPGAEPSAFLVESVAGLTPGRALVVAMGDGRNAAHLARLGFAVDGIDVSFEGARRALERIRAGGGSLGAVVADLDEFPLPTARYDLVAVQNFLNRRLFRSLARAVRPGGHVVYETFLRAHGSSGGPRSTAHLLDPGELRIAFPGFEIERYREVRIEVGGRPGAVASLFARRPGSAGPPLERAAG